MNNVASLPVAGYQLQRLYFPELLYSLADSDELQDAPIERRVDLGWDWHIVGGRAFEVMLHIALRPTKDRADRVRATLVGVFVAEQEACSVPFDRFVQLHATTLLLPYLRAAVSDLTGKGPLGTYHLPPINVHQLMKDFDITDTIGAGQLRDNPEAALSLGLLNEVASKLLVKPPEPAPKDT